MQYKFNNNEELKEEIVMKDNSEYEEYKKEENSRNISSCAKLSSPRYISTLILSVKGFDAFISYVKVKRIDVISHNCNVHNIVSCNQVRCVWELSESEIFELLDENIKQLLVMLKQDDYSYIWSTYEDEKQFRITNESKERDEPVLFPDSIVL